MPNPACPDCGYRFTRCVDKTEATPEYHCINCGCYFCEGEESADCYIDIDLAETAPLTE